VEILAHQPGHYVFGLWRNITIIYWMLQANGIAVRRLQAITATVAEAHAQGFSNIQIVKDGAGLPDAEARHGFSAMADAHANQLACVAIVLLGSGFWASAVQSMVTSLLMLAPRAFIMRFARSPLELRDWLPKEHHKRTQEEIDAMGLARAIEEVLRVGAASASTLNGPTAS
jgi:hypothetical protein